jgi:hypothetical protein
MGKPHLFSWRVEAMEEIVMWRGLCMDFFEESEEGDLQAVE